MDLLTYLLTFFRIKFHLNQTLAEEAFYFHANLHRHHYHHHHQLTFIEWPK